MKNTIANSLIIISINIMILYGIRKNNNFVNISMIIRDHFKIFDGAKKHIIVLYIIPIMTAIGIALLYNFSISMIEAIMVVISVVISALLSFQGGILNVESKSKDSKYRDILSETNASINFTVLINIFLVFIMLIYIGLANNILKIIFSSIIVYFLMITFLTILIIIKRIRILFKNYSD